MIQPKYNIGDKVWTIENNKCVEHIVSGIRLAAEPYEIYEYSVAKVYPIAGINAIGLSIDHKWVNEYEFFFSKESLLEHLTNSTD